MDAPQEQKQEAGDEELTPEIITDIRDNADPEEVTKAGLVMLCNMALKYHRLTAKLAMAETKAKGHATEEEYLREKLAEAEREIERSADEVCRYRAEAASLEQQVERLVKERDALENALLRCDGINDHPGHFNADLDAHLMPIIAKIENRRLAHREGEWRTPEERELCEALTMLERIRDGRDDDGYWVNRALILLLTDAIRRLSSEGE